MQRMLTEIKRYQDETPEGHVLAVLVWFSHKWPEYLRRRAADHDRYETQALLLSFGIPCPPWEPGVPDWRLALPAIELGHTPEVICRVLELGFRMERHGMGEMEPAVEMICWAMEGDHEGLDGLAGLGLLLCADDWKILSPWSPYAGLQILETLEDYFSKRC